MNLEQHIEEIRTGIRIGRFTNEAAVAHGIVLRLLAALGWPTYDVQVIWPEYSLGGRRVDFALCNPPGKPIAFVEVKQVGRSEGAERQLFEYAFHVGVPLAILTDGQEWNFFLPAEQGDYGERRVYKLDLLERDTGECVNRLKRYLQYAAVVSGQAIDNARADYRNNSRERQMQAAMPKAWQKLVEDEDEILLELIADHVESLCGYKPDLNTVAHFLKQQSGLRGTGPTRPPSRPTGAKATAPTRTAQPPPPSSPPISVQTSEQPSPLSTQSHGPTPGGLGFVFMGQHHPAKSARDVLLGVLEFLNQRDSTFLERLAARPKHGRKRRYVARTPKELYPDRPDLARDHVAQLSSGWWVGTNVSRGAVKHILELACEVAQVEFGRTLIVNLGD
jgi:hypothetical protein